MIRKVYALFLILICLINSASSGNDVDLPSSFATSGLLIHSVHVSHDQVLTQAAHSNETSDCANDFNSNDDCHSEEEEDLPGDCHHCHCTHYDSIHAHASDLQLALDIKPHNFVLNQFYLDEPISSIIKPPESHAAPQSLSIV